MIHQIQILGSIVGYSNFTESSINGLQSFFEFQTRSGGDSKKSNSSSSSSRAFSQNQIDDNKNVKGNEIDDCSSNWILVSGHESGWTQYHDNRKWSNGRNQYSGVWDHPIDLQYACIGVEGWPKLTIKVWSRDQHSGRGVFEGYGCCSCPGPTNGIERDVDVVIWRPEMSFWQWARYFFLGIRDSTDYEHQSIKEIQSVGVVHVKFTVITSRI